MSTTSLLIGLNAGSDCWKVICIAQTPPCDSPDKGLSDARPDEQQAMIAQDHDVAISETLVTARAIFGIFAPCAFDTRAVIRVLIKSDHPNISTRRWQAVRSYRICDLSPGICAEPARTVDVMSSSRASEHHARTAEAQRVISRDERRCAPWTQELLEIKHIAERCVATTFNSVLANLYQEGRDFGFWDATTNPAWVRPQSSLHLDKRRSPVSLMAQAGSFAYRSRSTCSKACARSWQARRNSTGSTLCLRPSAPSVRGSTSPSANVGCLHKDDLIAAGALVRPMPSRCARGTG